MGTGLNDIENLNQTPGEGYVKKPDYDVVKKNGSFGDAGGFSPIVAVGEDYYVPVSVGRYTQSDIEALMSEDDSLKRDYEDNDKRVNQVKIKKGYVMIVFEKDNFQGGTRVAEGESYFNTNPVGEAKSIIVVKTTEVRDDFETKDDWQDPNEYRGLIICRKEKDGKWKWGIFTEDGHFLKETTDYKWDSKQYARLAGIREIETKPSLYKQYAKKSNENEGNDNYDPFNVNPPPPSGGGQDGNGCFSVILFTVMATTLNILSYIGVM